jgi:sterol desaturase/sphingolipid hydroxylase (fatty acid hydroxylase superfamily)
MATIIAALAHAAEVRLQAIREFVANVADLDSGMVWMVLFFIALETIMPRKGVKVSTASRIRAVVFWSVYNVGILLLYELMWPLWSSLGVKPLLPDLAPPGLPKAAGILVGCAAAAFVGDFVYYWCHRFQHRFLWRFHAVHHSVRELSGAATYHHVSEEVFKFLLYMIPLSLLTRDPYAIPVFGWLLGLQGNYLHSPTKLHFGPLGRYFIDNRFHRIHHSVEERHFDKNFGLITTLWDSLFGTAHFPAADEWPDTGVADFPEPATIRQFLLSPFTYRQRPAPAPAADLAPERV